MKEREDFLKGFFSRRKDFLNIERIFLRKKIEKKVILNLKCKIEGVFSVLNSGDKRQMTQMNQMISKNQKFK